MKFIPIFVLVAVCLLRSEKPGTKGTDKPGTKGAEKPPSPLHYLNKETCQ
jgi:hypothetical protein